MSSLSELRSCSTPFGVEKERYTGAFVSVFLLDCFTAFAMTGECMTTTLTDPATDNCMKTTPTGSSLRGTKQSSTEEFVCPSLRGTKQSSTVPELRLRLVRAYSYLTPSGV
ncbi:MAG: hypothetical protein LBL13_05310 [Bacteroidales bacterium]|nr:hypothetical protein [Bacteroidales bacterium]